jgi:hypothetical protein
MTAMTAPTEHGLVNASANGVGPEKSRTNRVDKIDATSKQWRWSRLCQEGFQTQATLTELVPMIPSRVLRLWWLAALVVVYTSVDQVEQMSWGSATVRTALTGLWPRSVWGPSCSVMRLGDPETAVASTVPVGPRVDSRRLVAVPWFTLSNHVVERFAAEFRSESGSLGVGQGRQLASIRRNRGQVWAQEPPLGAAVQQDSSVPPGDSLGRAAAELSSAPTSSQASGSTQVESIQVESQPLQRGLNVSDVDAVRSSVGLSLWIDQQLDPVWRQAAVDVPACDDLTYLRRATLDLLGRIPSVHEAHAFQASRATDKRRQLVVQLTLDRDEPNCLSREHARSLATLWRRILLPPGRPTTSGDPQLPDRLEEWLQEQLRTEPRYDALARSLITAQVRLPDSADRLQIRKVVELTSSPSPMPFYEAVGVQPERLADESARVFLGARLSCAQCHDHPFGQWKKSDFWGFAAFFAGTELGPSLPTGATLVETRAEWLEVEAGRFQPRALGETPVSLGGDDLGRVVLAQWMTSNENIRFASAGVNRVWQSLLGRGLASDADDLDQVSDDEQQRLLRPLSQLFIKSGFDFRWLIQGICGSRIYQAPCLSPQDGAAVPDCWHGRRPLKVLTAEQIYSSAEQALLLPIPLNEGPMVGRTVGGSGFRQELVTRLNESPSRSPEEFALGIPQLLLLMNGQLTAAGTDLQASRTLRAVVDAPFLSADEKLDALFLAVLTRPPSDQERQVFGNHLQQRAVSVGYSEVFWALLNSPEFVLCR